MIIFYEVSKKELSYFLVYVPFRSINNIILIIKKKIPSNLILNLRFYQLLKKVLDLPTFTFLPEKILMYNRLKNFLLLFLEGDEHNKVYLIIYYNK